MRLKSGKAIIPKEFFTKKSGAIFQSHSSRLISKIFLNQT
jgi:hypothetical protein